MEHLNETKNELDRVRKTLARTEEDREMWKRLFEDWNKKQGKEIERLRQEYTERSIRLGLAGSVPGGQSRWSI